MKTYTNGNRQVEVGEYNNTIYVVQRVFDGVKWQSCHRKQYKSFQSAIKAAERIIAKISQGWTKYPEWTITEA